MRNTRTPLEREQLILERLPQVRGIARRVYEGVRGRVDLDDLISAGTLGLIAAIDHFDDTRGLQLKTYAEYKIRGAILDSLRALDGLSRDDRRRAKRIGAARTSLERRLQRRATHEEVAAEMGLTAREYAAPLTAPGASAPFSLDARIKPGDGKLRSWELVPDPAAFSPEGALVESELRGFVSGAVAALDPANRRIIRLHYSDGLTMRTIAPMLEMSEWQVQEARRKAITALRSRLAQSGLVEFQAASANRRVATTLSGPATS